MPLQYISDNEGNPTAVLIPISEWKLITNRHEDLKLLEQKPSKQNNRKPSDYAGTLPADIAEEMQKHIKKSRQDWD